MNINISILIDNKESWFFNYANQLKEEIKKIFKIDACIFFSQDDVAIGDICFILSCTKIVTTKNLNKNIHNIVVHPSALPKGRGFSPIAWDIIKGESKITLCLIKAIEKVDEGPIYIKRDIHLTGYELNEEIKLLQGTAVIEMCIEFIRKKDILIPEHQIGESTYYPKRSPQDSELNIDQSIKQQFNLLRIVDNQRYPAYFIIDNNKYIIRIDRA